MGPGEFEPAMTDHGQKANDNSNLEPGYDIQPRNDDLGAQVIKHYKGQPEIKNQVLPFQTLPERFQVFFEYRKHQLPL